MSVGTESLPSKLRRFRQSLDGVKCEKKQAEVRRVIVDPSDAGKWLLSDSTYRAWKGGGVDSARFLWLTGIPGAGKTVLSSVVISDLCDMREQDDEVAVLFFYFSPSGDATRLFSSLLDQLLGMVPLGSTALAHLLNTYSGKLKGDIRYVQALSELSEDFKRVFVIIDGLEWCGDTPYVLTDLNRLAKKFHVFVSSRDRPDIRRGLGEARIIRIRPDDIIEDALKFVEMSTRHLRARNPHLGESVARTLGIEAQGCFLWPASRIRQLQDLDVATEYNTRNALSTLPGGIVNIVDAAIRTIDAQTHSNFFLSFVRLVVGARRPLTAHALVHGISALRMGTTWDSKRVIHSPTSVINGCADLLVCVPVADVAHRQSLCEKPALEDEIWDDKFWENDISGEDHTIVPFHFSVTSALLAAGDGEQTVHSDIADLCLKYLDLVLQSKEPGQLNAFDYPFAKYALLGWPFHHRASRRPASYFPREAPKFLSWIPSRAHMAVRLDFPVIQGLSRAELAAVDDDGFAPLHVAVKNSASLAMIDCLLEEKVDVNQRTVDDESATALHFAMYHSNAAEVVHRLLHHGADCNARDANLQTPLHAICGNSYPREQLQYYKGVLRQLLASSNNVEIDLQDRQGRSPLHLAAMRGYVPFVTLLLEKGAKVDVPGLQSGSVLHELCARRYPGSQQDDYAAVLQQLLKRVLDIDERGRQRSILLHLSAFHLNAPFVALLLEVGAKVDDIDDTGQTALHKICDRVHSNDQGQNQDCESIIQYLLDQGAKINTRDKSGMTPLKLAEKNGHEHIIDQLRDLSINVSAQARKSERRGQDDPVLPETSEGIGIHFGTTCSRVGIWKDGRVEVIADDLGSRMIASYVAFSDTQRFIGDEARNQATRNPQNTVFCVKRLIGQIFHDPKVQADIKDFPFKVISKGGRPCIQVVFEGKTKEFWPEEIIAAVLGRLKQMAELRLGARVTNAVLTVPVSFNNLQCQAIQDAATIAGLNVLRVIPEPGAVALTVCLNPTPRERNVIMFGLGGGTCNVSFLTILEGVCEVKAVAGNARLGGQDFDTRLVRHFVREFQNVHRKDLTTSPRSLSRLRMACIRAKHELSTALWTSTELDSLFEGINFHVTITRDHFEDLCQDLLQNAMELIAQTLRDAEVDTAAIDEVILFGGSTRIPGVIKRISDFFNGKQPHEAIDLDEATVGGAALQAAILTGDNSDKTRDLLLFDVSPFSLGIETPAGAMTTLVKRGTSIPTKKSAIFTLTDLAASSDQCDILIRVYEGDCPLTKDNNLLGMLELSGLSPTSQIEITFEINANHGLAVRASDKSPRGKTAHITITNETKRLSRAEIKLMAEEATVYITEDKAAAARTSAKNNLENYAYALLDSLSDGELATKLVSYDKTRLKASVEGTISWLVYSDEASQEEYEFEGGELEDYTNHVMSGY